VRLAEHAFGNGAFQSQRVADRKDRFPYAQFFFRFKYDRRDDGVKILQPQDDKIVERGGSDNLDLLVQDAPQDLAFLQELGDGNMLTWKLVIK
jgi:hypothetical protein